MTEALREIWKNKFPLWPDELIEKFASLIAIQANEFDENYGSEEKKFFSENVQSSTKVFSWDNIRSALYAEIALLSPKNQRFLQASTFDFGSFWVFLSEIPEQIALNWLDPTQEARNTYLITTSGINDFIYSAVGARVLFDTRLFQQVNANFRIQYKITGGPYDRRLASGLGWRSAVYFTGYNQYIIDVSYKALPYRQVESLIALYENGKSFPGLDYGMALEFMAYFNAFKNYNQQIQTASNVAIKNSQADIQNFKADLQSKFIAQQNDLQNLQLTLTSQTQGQIDSAKRDIQAVKVQAMGIKLQILGMLK